MIVEAGVIDTHFTQFLARKIILGPLACGAKAGICALRKRLIEVVLADHAARPSPEMRTNSDLDTSNLDLTID